MPNSRAVAVAFGVVLVGVVGTMGYYMPVKSSGAIANRARVAGTPVDPDAPQKHRPGQGVSNSMWKNLEKHKRK